MGNTFQIFVFLIFASPPK